MELGAELLERRRRRLGEHVVDDADVLVVPERQVDMRLRDEVHRERAAGRAADGEAERAVPIPGASDGENDDGKTGRGRSSG